MSNDKDHDVVANRQPPFTTNEEDQAEAARLKARLSAASSSNTYSSSSRQQQCEDDKDVVPAVSIAPGTHKYVLISAIQQNNKQCYFVCSQKGAAYHRNVAEPMVYTLETNGGYRNIEITGGGRLSLDPDKRTISIFGFSYGFGQANHAVSRSVVEQDERYKDYNITISDDGY